MAKVLDVVPMAQVWVGEFAVRDLWVSKDTGKFSTAKMWRQIAYAVGTYIVLVNAKGISWELLGIYLAVVASSEVAQRVVTAKINRGDYRDTGGVGGYFDYSGGDRIRDVGTDQSLLRREDSGEALTRAESPGGGRAEGSGDSRQVRKQTRQSQNHQQDDY